MSSFQGVRIEWFHLYTGVSSFQGVRIEWFHLYTGMSSFQGVRIEEFHCIQGCPHFGGLGSVMTLIQVFYSHYFKWSSFETLYFHGVPTFNTVKISNSQYICMSTAPKPQLGML